MNGVLCRDRDMKSVRVGIADIFRGENDHQEKPEEKTEISEIDAPPLSRELKKRWSCFIRNVYETDPLICPKRQGEMRIICLCVHADRSVSLTSQRQLEKSFLSACGHAQAGNTWVYGKSPTPLLKASLPEKR